MNRFYAHTEAGEPTVRLNDYDPADPFVVVDFGGDWDFTSKDPRWCRRVAAAWTQAAQLLEQATECDRAYVDGGDHLHAARRERSEVRSP